MALSGDDAVLRHGDLHLVEIATGVFEFRVKIQIGDTQGQVGVLERPVSHVPRHSDRGNVVVVRAELSVDDGREGECTACLQSREVRRVRVGDRGDQGLDR